MARKDKTDRKTIPTLVIKNKMNEAEKKLRGQIAQLLRKNALVLSIHSSPYKSEEIANEIHILYEDTGWKSPEKVAEAIQKLQTLEQWVAEELPEYKRRVKEIREGLETL